MIFTFFWGVYSIDILSKVVLFYPTDNNIAQRNINIKLSAGIYQFEVWGAQGGMGAEGGYVNSNAYGGKGAYATTYIRLSETRTVYCYFGQEGSKADPSIYAQGRNAYNGGGSGGYHWWKYAHTAGGGGGGTDCRLYPGDISNETSRNSRFVVAGGGSGGGGNCPGAPGGGFYPFRMKEVSKGVYAKQEVQECQRGGIGDNGAPYNSGNGDYTHSFSGAGGGFCGGKASQNSHNSFEAISRSGTSWGLGCSIPLKDGPAQFSVKKEDQVIFPLDECKVLNGDDTLPSPKSMDGTEKGHEGNGAVRISQILVNKGCTNGQVKVIRKKNHGIYYSLLSLARF